MINVISAPKKEKCSFSAKTYYQAHHPIDIVIHVQFILRTDTKSVIFEVIKSFIVIDNIMRLIFFLDKTKKEMFVENHALKMKSYLAWFCCHRVHFLLKKDFTYL